MKGEEPLLDRSGLYTQLQQMLTPGSSNSVLELLPSDARAVWQALGAAAGATAAKHARAGDAPEVQQEMALQRLQQLLEAAARGEPVSLETEAKDEGEPQLLLNKVIPQVLAHKPFTDLRGFQEEKRMLLGSAEDCTEGNRCVNKEQVSLSVVLDPEEVRGAALEAQASGGPPGAPFGGPSRMNDDIRVHWRWQQRRVQQLKGRMQRRMLGPPNGTQVKMEKADGEEPGKRKVEEAEIAGDEEETEAVNAAGEVILVGRLMGEGGRRLCWANAVLEPLDGSAPLQLLHLQEALQRQQLQLQQWQISRLQRHTPAPDAVLFPGMVIAAKGRLQQDGYGQQLSVSAFHCGLPVPAPRRPASLDASPGVFPLDKAAGSTRSLSAQQQQQQGQQNNQVIDVAGLYKKQNVHILMASCAFLVPSSNGGWMLRRNALNGLLSVIRESLPHLVVLFGPIVCWLNLHQPDPVPGGAGDAASLRCAPLLQVPEFSLAYAEFFRRLSAAVQGLRTRVVIVPHSKDAMHPEPLPQPPYPSPPENHMPQALSSTIHCVTNPCTLQVNEVRLLLSSADPAAEVAGEVLCDASSQSAGEARMQQICRALLRQRTLFPRGVSPRVPMDASRLKPLMFDGDDVPHVVAFPSAALPLQQEGGGGCGACACSVDGRVFLSPFNPQNRSDDAFDFTNVYIQPPAEAAVPCQQPEDTDMKLAERIAVKYCVCRPRSTQRPAVIL